MEIIKLDPDQKKAVEHFEGPALVVAGPGSGKTTVIIKRILNLIQKHEVNPEQILAIAFTNAAADEMRERFSNEPVLNHGKPKICTLHVFGNDLITEHYGRLEFSKMPDTWDADDIKQIIDDEKNRLKRANEKKSVVIYKFEGTTTGRCYIGQTTNPGLRELEHRTHSSNRELREALQKGDEQFEFKEIETVNGQEADAKEAEEINLHRNRAAIKLNQEVEQIERENPNAPVTIYKIKSSTTVTCYFGLTADIEDIDGPEGFEIIEEDMPLVEARRRIAREIAKHRNWAVLNRQDPLQARESNKRRIEIFCRHFKVSYDEVLKHTPKFRDLMKKFDRLKDDIEHAKRQVSTGLFAPDKIDDPVFRAFAKRYEDTKKEADAIDFLDMLIYSANMLENNPDLLREYCKKYRYVFVDEFQDISPVDFRLIDLFSENLFAVGDDDQAIYGFRGGDSEIMQTQFGQRENVTRYKITRNYRSTSTLVRHAKALIEHNEPERIPKNLRANNSAQTQVQVLQTPQGTIKQALLKELSNLLTTDFKEVGILARNWKGEINEIQEILNCSELKTQGFEIAWKKLDDLVYEKSRRIMFLRRGTQKIEILNIHTAKGREWDKVIFLVNTMYESLPRKGNDLIDERRLFYVAITRAKQELVVLDGGNCQFIPEFRNVPPTKEELEEAFRMELAVQESKFMQELEKATKTALVAQKFSLKQELEEATKSALKQLEPELNRLRRAAAEHKDETKKMELALPQQIKSTNDAFLEGAIPVLDAFESQINSLPTSVESNDIPIDLALLIESFQLAHKQMLDSLKNYGLRPMETYGEIFNTTYHEDVLPAIYSDEVQTGLIAREERRGYLLHEQVVRKAQVVISKGENIRTSERLDRVVDIYLNRLIFAFQVKYKLSNIDQRLVKQEVVEYLLKLDDESLKEIVSFACKNKAEAIQLKRYADYCVGQERIHRCTGVFRGFWNKMWEVITTQNKNIRQADTLLNQDFVQPVRFVTYAGFRDLRNIETLNDGIKGLNSQGEEAQLQNLNVLFAFPKKDMAALKSHIKRRRIIANQNLQPIELMSERFQIANDLLESLLIKRDVIEVDDQNPTVRLVTRSGHVLNGYLWDFDEDFLYMKINTKDVIVYRSGILRFVNLTWNEITKAYKDGDPIDGYITKRIRDGFQVKFQSLIGFLPTSQVELYPVQHLDSYIGKTYKMKVIKVNEANNHFVLSRRAWLKEQNTKLFKLLSEVSAEPPKLRNIKRMSKVVEAIPGTNRSPHAPEAERIPLDKSISVIVLELVAEVTDASPSISAEITESPNTYIKDFKPETHKTVEVRRDPLYESIDLIVPDPVKKVVDSRLPTPKDFSEIPNPQTQNLTPEILEIEIDPKLLDAVHSNSLLTSQEYADILKKQIQDLKSDALEPDIVSYPPIAVDNGTQETSQGHKAILKNQIQDIKPETSEPENSDNVTQVPTLETSVDHETPVESRALTRSDSSTEIDSDTHQINGQNPSKNEAEDAKKSLRYYLRRGGRFAVEKIKATIFKKPNS